MWHCHSSPSQFVAPWNSVILIFALYLMESHGGKDRWGSEQHSWGQNKRISLTPEGFYSADRPLLSLDTAPKLLIMLIRKIPRPGGYCTRWCKAKEDLTFISAPKHYFFELYMNHPMLPRPPPAITLLGAVQPHKDSV